MSYNFEGRHRSAFHSGTAGHGSAVHYSSPSSKTHSSNIVQCTGITLHWSLDQFLLRPYLLQVLYLEDLRCNIYCIWGFPVPNLPLSFYGP